MSLLDELAGDPGGCVDCGAPAGSVCTRCDQWVCPACYAEDGEHEC